jgi:hypothetical protein
VRSCPDCSDVDSPPLRVRSCLSRRGGLPPPPRLYSTTLERRPGLRETGAKPRLSGRGYAPYTPPRNRKLQYCRRRTVYQANRVKCQPEAPGPLPAGTDDSTPAGGKPAGEYVVQTRSSSSQYPSPSLETGGNARANEGVTAYQSLPRSRLPTLPTRVGVESGRWHDPCRFRRKDGTGRRRSDGRPCCG